MSRLIDDMSLTRHFTLYEFLVSKDCPHYARELNPSPLQINNLHLLCATVLEPVRERFGIPIIVSSGYRDLRLNNGVGGRNEPISLHTMGKAVDFRLLYDRPKLGKAFKFIKRELPHAWTQLIHYKSRGFIHVALPHPGRGKLCEVRR